ncbi:MAG: D-alanyl-D-alanine carboxypeptidase/D-alanyl-D-alanine-endopeptidase [Steroidobacteraceae bacterium]|jgi:D-alanyl-D-alanine carboxypeptidase/D-alanyl-D-alanine-endopeptidase (penicillin-binding protein 4)|nr:D-alanyl-D-alanine carboxypeptidase/D-alanyl-D-alanine-endopeptidase [Steroidobacteraceae bacterium]
MPIHAAMPRFLVLGLLLSCTALPAQARELPESSRAVLKQQLVPDQAVTVVVRNATTGESLVEMNPDTPRNPASVMKLLPTYAALEILGPAYTWRTRAYADGPVVGGVLKGNLYLRGGGDPLLTIERWWRFVTDLRQTGLRAIEGDIVIDDGLFAETVERPGDFDGRPWRTYNVLPHALLVNLHSAEFTVRPGDDRQSIAVAVSPFPGNLKVENRARVVDGRCTGRNRTFSLSTPADDPNKVVVTGNLSRDCPPQTERRVIMRPADYAYGTFRRLWEDQGGSVAGGMRRGPTPPQSRELLSQESLTLAEIVRVVNKFSSNVMARTLVLTLAAEKMGTPATTGAGEVAIADWLHGRGLDFPELVIANGSGLARDARISGDSMARMLVDAWKSRYAPEFLASMALGGLDGTLRRRFANLDDGGRVRMKTGTLNGVSSLAGYVSGRSGRTYVVVIMVNHQGAQYGPGDSIQRAVVDWVLSQ